MTHEGEPTPIVPDTDPTPAPVELATPDSAQPAVDLGAIRELVLRAHPDVVPELIAGDTVDAMLASIAPAEAAYQRISRALIDAAPAAPASPPVPAGGGRPMPVDPDRLPASEKIRRGLGQRE